MTHDAVVGYGVRVDDPSAQHDLHSALARRRRLRVLEGTRLLDAPAEDRYDRFTRLATAVTGAPVALISLVTPTRQFFASHRGLPEPWATQRETPLSHSFCKHVVVRRAPLVVVDAAADELVRDNLAVSEIGVRAYAGVPIELDGEVIGSFCAIHGEPHEWTEHELASITDLAGLVVDQLLLERAAIEAEQRRRSQGRQALELHAGIAQHVRAARLANQVGAADDLTAALDSAAQGIEAIIDGLAASATDDAIELPGASGFSELSSRESEVYDLVALGLNNREISDRLGISIDTTKKHVSSVLRKLGVPSRAAAIAQRRP